MLKYFFSSGIRYLNYTRMFSLINIFGLAVGLATSILLLQFVAHEYSYDRFHNNFHNIYRSVSHVEMADGKTVEAPSTISQIAPALIKNIPEVPYACRIINNGPEDIKYNSTDIGQYELFFTDPDFFKVFSFEILFGDPWSGLNSPNSIVITNSIASKINPSGNPIGEIIEIGREKFRIVSVLEDIPANSHMKFDIITSFKTLKNPQEYFNNQGVDFFTYFLINQETDIEEFEITYSNLCNKLSTEKFLGTGIYMESYIQALKDIHLHSGYFFDIGEQGNYSTIIIFLILAIIIIIIACINFINLVTATAENRGVEVGIKKVVGASGKELVKQFLGESVIIALISLFFAFFVVEIASKPFGDLINRDLDIKLFLRPDYVIGTIILSVVIGLLSGLYPSIYLTRFNPVQTLKRIRSSSKRNKNLKIFLVIVQFTIAIFLITNIFVINRQVNYMKDRDPGFIPDNVVVIKDPSVKLVWNYLSLKTKLLSSPEIQNVTASQSYPGELRRVQNLYLEGDKPENGIICNENRVQVDYIETYQMQIIEGRSFSDDFITDKFSFIINETAARDLGLKNPLGKIVNCMSIKGNIIGVVKDYHYKSLHEKIEPLILSNYDSWITSISINIGNGDVNNVFNHKIRSAFYEFDPDFNINPLFVSDLYDKMYSEEEKNNILIAIATILSIIISVLGLFSLTSYTVIRRTKEIGIRKVMGASIPEIVKMLIKDLLKWVIFVNLIAWPLSYIYMNRWLANFAYQVEIRPWMFILSGLITLIIAIMAISFQSLKAARTNPAEALQYE